MDWQQTITNLLIKAENPAATAEERQAFSAKAAYLMGKFGITELLDRPADVPLNVVSRFIDLPMAYATPRSILINGISQAMGCKAVRTRKNGKVQVQVFGLPNDLERFTTLFVSLWIQANLSLAASEKPTHVHGKTHTHSYLLGFVHEVVNRVSAATQRAEGDTKSATQVSTEVVLANRQTAVDRAVADIFPKLNKRYGTDAKSNDSYHNGVRAGSTADINQPRMGGGTARQRQLG